ncbi:hypothetical protein LK09_12815 [Microbacterium mangrovi]|uniref:Uncharacterized protein n=1 Tax=Microbacterium mangrovi TaxID=1348253 RepID=A0A0B2A0Z3_9MICO|nr:hypothetical protein [Microbacterium mangrovi]KHK97145.1 hypothetical protein LK09_12815 [Microbacterium mangrovi]
MTRVLSARQIWDSRRPRSAADRAYIAYATVMCALIFVVPVGRALWLGITAPTAVAALLSPAAPSIAGILVDALWIAALLAGRARGPAVLAPFLTWSLARSERPRLRSFRRPLLLSCALIVTVTTTAAVLCGGSLLATGGTGIGGLIAFAAAGMFAGLIAFALWLVGQAHPRPAAWLGALFAVLGGAGLAVPALQSVLPWGWIAGSFPSSGSAGIPATAALAAAAIALVSAVPPMLERLDPAALDAQAARWDSAVTHTVGLDFNAASSTYQARPTRGRHTRAVGRRGSFLLLFARRDLIGALRTPGRFAAGVLGLAGAGILIALALVPSAPQALLGSACGLVLFVSLGALTDGIRHAADVASGLPMYGIGDAHLLLAHTVMPLAIGTVVAVSVAAATALATGTAPGGATLSCFAVVVLAVATRISNAVKGPMPLALLMPAPSPLGDPMPLIRLAWAADAVLVTLIGGACAAVLWTSPVPFAVVASWVTAVGLGRWRRRR